MKIIWISFVFWAMYLIWGHTHSGVLSYSWLCSEITAVVPWGPYRMLGLNLGHLWTSQTTICYIIASTLQTTHLDSFQILFHHNRLRVMETTEREPRVYENTYLWETGTLWAYTQAWETNTTVPLCHESRHCWSTVLSGFYKDQKSRGCFNIINSEKSWMSMKHEWERQVLQFWSPPVVSRGWGRVWV